jgi:hypothetical protein
MLATLIAFGFLPVIAYLAVESFAGMRKALWSALAVGALEFGYVLGAGGGIDFLGLLSLLLLAGLVMASLRTGDDFWFRIHGAVICASAALTLMVAWYGFDRALLLDFAERQHSLADLSAMSGDPRLTPEVVAELLRLFSFQLPWWLLMHALFTLHAASHWSKWGWAMVRLPGFLLMFILASGFTQGEMIGELKDKDPPAKTDGPAGTAKDGKVAKFPEPGQGAAGRSKEPASIGAPSLPAPW